MNDKFIRFFLSISNCPKLDTEIDRKNEKKYVVTRSLNLNTRASRASITCQSDHSTKKIILSIIYSSILEYSKIYLFYSIFVESYIYICSIVAIIYLLKMFINFFSESKVCALTLIVVTTTTNKVKHRDK